MPSAELPVWESFNFSTCILHTSSHQLVFTITIAQRPHFPKMPPRISPRHFEQPLVCQCFRTRPQSAPPQSRFDLNPSRPFHASSPNATRLRRDMFAWLKGPGKAFRKPLPGSSNYLSAYDRQGNLVRKGREERDDRRRFADLGEDEVVLQARDRQAKLSEEEIQIRASERETRRAELKEMEERDGLPKEGARDLKPYPLNAQFKSQPVLSEDLRRAINELVTENGIDLKAVSAAFGIDVRRVAAVVRLMEVEKAWEQEVSVCLFFLEHNVYCDDFQKFD